MKILSLTQPWASLVAIGAKRFETRSWSTSYRGPLGIAAAKRFPRECRELCDYSPFTEVLDEEGLTLENLLELCGNVLAVVDLVDVVRVQGYPPRLPGLPEPAEFEEDFGNYAPGRFAWITTNVRRLPRPVPASGRLGLWELFPKEQALVDEQLKEAA